MHSKKIGSVESFFDGGCVPSGWSFRRCSVLSLGEVQGNLFSCLFVCCLLISLMHVYVTHANFTSLKPRFEIKNKRSFTEMNSQGSRVEKNTHAQKVQMQKILFTNEACW